MFPKPSYGPGPGAYDIPSIFGGDDVRRVRSPCYTIGGRTKRPRIDSIGPGPAAYKVDCFTTRYPEIHRKAAEPAPETNSAAKPESKD